MNTMTHHGYAARIEYSDEDGCFIGHIAGIRDIVGFHADTVAKLRRAFSEAVDDYLQASEKSGRSPQRSYSGKMLLRVDAATHAAVAMAAEASGQSLNQWAAEALRRAV